MIWRYRSRLPALKQDLARLGHDPWKFPMPRMLVESDPSSVAGILYVIEGSTLGGRLIAGQVRAALGNGVPVSHFLFGDVADWPAFLALLELNAGALDADRAVFAACRTFEGLKQHLDNCMRSIASV